MSDELARLEQRLDDHIKDEILYRRLLDEKLDPILDAINAGKLGYRFFLGFIGTVASLLGLLVLWREIK